MDFSFIHIGMMHSILLGFFTIATTILALVTLSNSLRLRNVLQTWKGGKLGGFPLFSSLFLGFLFFMTIVIWNAELTQYNTAMFSYIWIGLNWFVASHLMMKRFITDHGIVKNINDPSQTISWHEIVDYAERKEGGNYRFTFIYNSSEIRSRRKEAIKLELIVPEEENDEFRKILGKKLGRRFNPPSVIPDNIEAIIKKHSN
ncbi:MAG: hypothetical protein WEB89_04370 [Balneolales bacterium]